jgi:hypothetical protein
MKSKEMGIHIFTIDEGNSGYSLYVDKKEIKLTDMAMEDLKSL